MQCEALKHALITLSGFTSTSSRNCKADRGLLKKRGGGEGALLLRKLATASRTVIQASSPLTKKQIFKFLKNLLLQILKFHSLARVDC